MRAVIFFALLSACSRHEGPEAPGLDTAITAPTSTVYVVRHAETGSTATDPPLDASGQARAQALATMLADKGIAQVLSSQYMRTKLTAMPTATAAGVPVIVQMVASANAATYGSELATMVRDAMPHAALIVGHSNTVPDVVKAFTGTTINPIAETEYDRLFTITVTAESTTFVEGRY